MLAGAASNKGELESIFVSSLLIVEDRLDHRRIGENLRAEVADSEAGVGIRCIANGVGEA